MKRLILNLFIALTVCGAMFASPAFSTTINFDSFAATYSGGVGDTFPIGDVTFTGWSLSQDSSTTSNYLAFDFSMGFGGITMASITFKNPVYLESFDFLTLASGVEVSFDSDIATNITSNQLWATQTYGEGTTVTNIVFSSPAEEFVTTINLDNLKYSAVPLPGALCFLASALLGVTGLRKKYFS